MISVCMATYNGMPYINKQVNSILSQLGEDDELIVSDDGSVDNTRKMLLSLQDSRVKLFSNSPNNGVVSNFENALLHAAGDIIFLSDQDDIWRNDKAIMISEKLLTNIMVVSDCAIINENDAIAFEEIKFGDNDTLSALVATNIGAEALVLFSDIDGLYRQNPKIYKNAEIHF